MTITLGGLSEMYWYFRLSAKLAFTLDTEARGLLPFYAILVQLHTFTVLRQNALTFTQSTRSKHQYTSLKPPSVNVIHMKQEQENYRSPTIPRFGCSLPLCVSFHC